MSSITPRGACLVNTYGSRAVASTWKMDLESSARIDRLVEWCKANRACLDEGGEIDAKKLSESLQAKGVKGIYSYWQGMLAKADDRSFGAKKAREVEQALGIKPLLLEGGEGGWPFTDELGDAVARLSIDDLWHAEVSLRAHLKLPIPAKPPGGIRLTSGDAQAEDRRVDAPAQIYLLLPKEKHRENAQVARLRGPCVKDSAFWCRHSEQESAFGDLPTSCGRAYSRG